jgi:putative flippase GtrA
LSRHRENALCFGRYALVGGAAWTIDLAVFVLLWPVIGVLAAQVSARLLGAITAFFGHKLWVFRHPDLRTSVLAMQGLAYSILWLLSLVLSLLVLAWLIRGLGLVPLAAKVLTEVLVLVFNFGVLRHLIFRRGASAGGGSGEILATKCLP